MLCWLFSKYRRNECTIDELVPGKSTQNAFVCLTLIVTFGKIKTLNGTQYFHLFRLECFIYSVTMNARTSRRWEKKKWMKNRFLSFISLFATIVNAFAHNERFLLMSNLQGKLSSIENQWPFRNEIEFPGLMLGSVHFRLNALSCSHLNCAYTQTNRFQSRFQMLVFTSHSVWKIRIRIRHRKLYWISLKSSTMRHSCVCVRESEAQSSTKLQSAKISKSFNHEIAQRSRRRRTQCHRHNARTATMHILHVYPRCRYMNMAFIVTSTLKCARYESMIYLNTSLNQWIDCSNATYYY